MSLRLENQLFNSLIGQNAAKIKTPSWKTAEEKYARFKMLVAESLDENPVKPTYCRMDTINWNFDQVLRALPAKFAEFWPSREMARVILAENCQKVLCESAAFMSLFDREPVKFTEL